MFCVVIETTDKVLSDRRNAFLVEIGDRTRDLRHPRAVEDVAAEALGRQLGGAHAGYGEVEFDDARINVEGGWHAQGASSMAGQHRLIDHGETFVHEYRTGRTVVLADFDADPRATARSAATC